LLAKPAASKVPRVATILSSEVFGSITLIFSLHSLHFAPGDMRMPPL
jgi:hypothetical protein